MQPNNPHNCNLARPRDTAEERAIATLQSVLVQPVRAVADHDPGASAWLRSVARATALAGVSRALRQAEIDLEWLARQQLAVCRVPAPTFSESARSAHLSRIFRKLGHCPSIDDAGNVVLPFVHSARLPYVAVTAHMDTILAPSAAEDIRVEPDGTFRGPGVADNGPGLAALVGLAKLLAEPLVEAAERNVLLVANVAEEGEGNLRGIRYLAEDSPYAGRIDRYLVLDGAALEHITHAAVGCKRFELVIEGPGGHSWNDFGAPHPVHALARAISLMTAARLPSQPKTTLSIGVIQGGASVNSIPAAATAKIDVRSVEPCEIRRVERAVEDAARKAVALEGRNGGGRLGCVLREIGQRPAAPALPCNPVAACLRAVNAHLGIPAVLGCASTDANIPLAAGIPAAAIGCGGRGGNAHAPGEWYNPEGREIGLQRLLLGIACLQMQP